MTEDPNRSGTVIRETGKFTSYDVTGVSSQGQIRND